MKKNILALIMLFVGACNGDHTPSTIDGRYIGFAEISGYKYVVEFNLQSDRHSVFGEMIFYEDTMALLYGSRIYGDSIVMIIDYVINSIDFVFKGEVLGDCEAIRGQYMINSVSGLRYEPFEIYKEIR